MAANYRQLACMLFEHDIYFQSIARGLASMRGLMDTAKASCEYLRALRYELRMLPRFDRVQVCSPDNGDYLLSFLPQLRGRIDDNRAGIETSRYEFRADGPRAGHDAVPRELPPSSESGSAQLVRAEGAAGGARAQDRTRG